jgi:hypothetical protein
VQEREREREVERGGASNYDGAMMMMMMNMYWKLKKVNQVNNDKPKKRSILLSR